MIKEKKENSRSIRYTNTVRDFVDQQDGEGFNEKFENMVLYCMKKLPDIEAEIKLNEKYLKELENKISKKQTILNTLNNITYSIDRLENEIKRIVGSAENI